MKKNLLFILSALGLAVLTACTQKSAIAKMDDAQVYKITEDAYVFAAPLIILDLFATATTNTVDVTDEKAPMNQLFHAKTLTTPQTASLTRPNNDTVYSQAYLDLSKEPMVFFKPQTDRFCAVQVFDGYSNSPNILGTGFLGGNNAVSYVFTGPDFKGQIPAGLEHIAMPTNLVWLLIRTKANGTQDLPNVYAVQNKMKLYPLSYFGKEYTPPKGEYKKENDFKPLQKFDSLSIQEYFDMFNKLSVKNPPAAIDEPVIKEFAKLNIGPGLQFKYDELSESQKKAVNAIPEKFKSQIVPNGAKIYQENGWFFMDKTVGIFGTDYSFRASVAYNGFANPVAMAIYPTVTFGPDGKVLSGKNKYSLTFAKGQLPPYYPNGFWSLTAYDNSTGRLIENPIKRYTINELTKLTYNPDGSVTIYIQNETPDKAKESNWLPVGTGDFSVTMRIYMPNKSIFDGMWKPPVLQMN